MGKDKIYFPFGEIIKTIINAAKVLFTANYITFYIDYQFLFMQL